MTETKPTRLEDLKEGASVEGLTPSGTAKVVKVEWFGDQAVKVIFEEVKIFVRLPESFTLQFS